MPIERFEIDTDQWVMVPADLFERIEDYMRDEHSSAGEEIYSQLCEIAAAPRQAVEPVAWEFQHEETGLIDFVDPQQVEWGFEKANPRWQKIGPVYRHPPAQPIPTSERLPTEADADCDGRVFVWMHASRGKCWLMTHWMNARHGDYWLPTGLKMPPAPGGSDE